MSRIEQLNLARKWRSANFDQLIGQELSVNMIKNSLYRQHFFPVYLFAGQRGCGKTSMARIFAAALNCEQLDTFSKKPKQAVIPCLMCPSCQAMQAGRHPDFIEIDAASHTGVDNVRQIIEASSLVPLMGRKKVYLIDEAHMLSKAAFNAFLKLLEEPPASVLFILATTDAQKIIETVRSRCFQLFFKSVDTQALVTHLQHICTEEKIVCSTDALELIVKEAHGSVRDAINLLEQVRFSAARVTKTAVQNVLGHFDDARLLVLFETVVTKTPHELLQFTAEHNLSSYSVEFLWRSLTELTRVALWLKHGVTPQYCADQISALQNILVHVSKTRLVQLLELLYTHELHFLKTTAQYPLFEMILLQLCQKNDTSGHSGTPSQVSPSRPVEEDVLCAADDQSEDQHDEDENEEEDEDVLSMQKIESEGTPQSIQLWNQFILRIESAHDPLVTSVFKQGIFDSFKDNKITIHFSKDLSFFRDSLIQARHMWEPELKELFGYTSNLDAQFILASVAKSSKVVMGAKDSALESNVSSKPAVRSAQPVMQRNQHGSSSYTQSAPKLNEPRVDISDKAAWKMTHNILAYFPGTVTQISEKSL